jgi:hypothetical protein
MTAQPVGQVVQMPERFSLRNVARRVLDEMQPADPAEAAGKILNKLSDGECREALAQVLPRFVRDIASQVAAPARQPGKLSLSTPARVRAWYEQVLATNLFTGSEWKFLRDCTQADIRGAADERFKVAVRTQSEADRLVKLADTMARLKATTVADVPEDRLKAVWSV